MRKKASLSHNRCPFVNIISLTFNLNSLMNINHIYQNSVNNFISHWYDWYCYIWRVLKSSWHNLLLPINISMTKCLLNTEFVLLVKLRTFQHPWYISSKKAAVKITFIITNKAFIIWWSWGQAETSLQKHPSGFC